MTLLVCCCIARRLAVLLNCILLHVVQKNPADAASYFSRRMTMMKEQLDKAYGVLNQKRQLFEAVSHMLQTKLEMAQAAQAQAGGQRSG